MHSRLLAGWKGLIVAAAVASLALAVAASAFLAFRMTRSLRRLSAATAALIPAALRGARMTFRISVPAASAARTPSLILAAAAR